MSKCFVSVIFSLMFISINSFAYAEKMNIAVMDLKPVGIDNNTAVAASNIIRNELIKNGDFNVIERTQMDLVLKEQGIQQTGLIDQRKAIEIGKMMSAKKILIGEVNSIGTNIIITIRIVDVENGISEFSSQEQISDQKKLANGAVKLVELLTDSVKRRYDIETRTMQGYYLRGIIPGWGQIYADSPVKGSLYLSSTVFLSVFTIYSGIQWSQNKKDYDKLNRYDSQDEFDKRYKAKKNSAMMTWAGMGTIGAVYVANWLDIIFLSKPNYKKENGENYNAFNFYMNPSFNNEICYHAEYSFRF